VDRARPSVRVDVLETANRPLHASGIDQYIDSFHPSLGFAHRSGDARRLRQVGDDEHAVAPARSDSPFQLSQLVAVSPHQDECGSSLLQT